MKRFRFYYKEFPLKSTWRKFRLFVRNSHDSAVLGLRQLAGGPANRFRKALRKVLAEWKPHSTAMAAMVRSVSRSSFQCPAGIAGTGRPFSGKSTFLLKESTFCLIPASFWRDFWNAVWYNGLENVSSGKGCWEKFLSGFAGRDPAFCGAWGVKLLPPPVLFRKGRTALFRGPGDSR